MTDQDYMNLALREARQAYSEGEIPIGAVLVSHDTVIAADHNRREKTGDPTAHAEVLVIQRGARRLGRWRLTDCWLYVTIEPCLMCAGAIMNARIDRLIYGASNPKDGCFSSKQFSFTGQTLNHTISVTHGIEESKCLSLMNQFFESHRT
jgi:tRNA(adenine34) deaminase